MRCDNDNTSGNYIYFGGCFNGKAEYKLTIKYNDTEKDILYLCKTCMNNIKKDAEKHNYNTESKKVLYKRGE